MAFLLLTLQPPYREGLDIAKRDITRKIRSDHDLACERLAEDSSNWTSHTVIVVDQSGSMRKTDVDGGATRSDAVWVTIAIDFVAKQIETRMASDSDVVSILRMGREATLLVDRKPHNWLLFNDVVDLLRSQIPLFQGN